MLLFSGTDHITIVKTRKLAVSGKLMVPQPDEDRTERLKIALDCIWKKLDPSAEVFKRFPFDPEQPMVPRRRRSQQGRFISKS